VKNCVLPGLILSGANFFLADDERVESPAGEYPRQTGAKDTLGSGTGYASGRGDGRSDGLRGGAPGLSGSGVSRGDGDERGYDPAASCKGSGDGYGGGDGSGWADGRGTNWRSYEGRLSRRIYYKSEKRGVIRWTMS